ncbi:LysR family transcriptional regulator [Paenalcaligenes niemegkensis]|uniref:LysR family transcriptional regulator n=1 Tax=Paenalcaligenes niemegkensis TaxID=2895469 RepID=UPI001EE8FA11|nr:LysR family transcriptional regulator [Paenalcaligenes niemegkensis]MCQ9616188.1 LysR family transcriptional regulator [Paenalcaligenes niemegkensis]
MQKFQENRLDYFHASVRLGSIRGAAESLKVAASAVSRQISLLEQELGMALLERNRRGVIPTQAGELLIDYYRQHSSHRDDMLAELESLRGLHSGSVSVVMGEGFTQAVVVGLLPIFRRDYPDISVSIDVAGTTAIMRRLADDIDEIGLVYYPPEDPRIVSRWVGSQPMHLIVPSNHPLIGQEQVSLAELGSWPLALLHGRYGIRQLIEHAEHIEKFKLNPCLSTNLISVVVSFVESGQGVTLLPKFSVTSEIAAGTLCALPIASTVLQQAKVQLVTRAGRSLSPAAKCFLRYCIQGMRAFDAGTLYDEQGELDMQSLTRRT